MSHERDQHQQQVDRLKQELTKYQDIESRCNMLTNEMKQYDAVCRQRDDAKMRVRQLEQRLENCLQDKIVMEKVLEDTRDSIDILRMEYDAVCERERSKANDLAKCKKDCTSFETNLSETLQENCNLQDRLDSCMEENAK